MRGKIATILGAAVAVFSFSRPAAAGPGESCTHPTIKIYPGSTLGRARYGVVEFHFDVCSGKPPGSWKAAVTKSKTNTTGNNLGFFIESTSIKETDGGYYYRFYEGQIDWKSCTPRVGWPCAKSGTFHVEFYAYDVDGRPYVAVTKMDTGGDRGFTLYKTP